MFGKQKTIYNAIDDSKTVVNDFRLRTTVTSYESYRTVEYRLYHKLQENEMLPMLEEHLTKLFAGEVDDGNGDMLDSIIFGTAREALPDLRRQQEDHDDMLRRLTIRRLADRDDTKRVREDRVKERDSIQADYDKICQALAKCEEV